MEYRRAGCGYVLPWQRDEGMLDAQAGIELDPVRSGMRSSMTPEEIDEQAALISRDPIGSSAPPPAESVFGARAAIFRPYPRDDASGDERERECAGDPTLPIPREIDELHEEGSDSHEGAERLDTAPRAGDFGGVEARSPTPAREHTPAPTATVREQTTVSATAQQQTPAPTRTCERTSTHTTESGPSSQLHLPRHSVASSAETASIGHVERSPSAVRREDLGSSLRIRGHGSLFSIARQLVLEEGVHSRTAVVRERRAEEHGASGVDDLEGIRGMGDELVEVGQAGLSSTLHDKLGGNDRPQVEREAGVEVVQVDDGAQVEREAGVEVDDHAQVEREAEVEVDDRAQIEREAGVEVDDRAQVEREAGVEVVQLDDGAQVEREAGVEVDDRAQVETEAGVEVDGGAQVEREAGVEVDDGAQVEREAGVEVDDRAHIEREEDVVTTQVGREEGVAVPSDAAQGERQEDVVRAEGDDAHDGGEGSDTLDTNVERFIADELGPALLGLTSGTMRALGASPSTERGAIGDEMRDFAQMSFEDPPTPRQSRRADIEDIARALAAAGYSAEDIEQAFAGASRIRTRDTLQQGYEEAREHPQEAHDDAAASEIPGGSGSKEVAPDEVPPVVVVDLGSESPLQTSVSGRRAPEDTACPFDAAELARAVVRSVIREEDTYSRRPGMPPPPPRSRHAYRDSSPRLMPAAGGAALEESSGPEGLGMPRGSRRDKTVEAVTRASTRLVQVRRGDDQVIVVEDDPETEPTDDEDLPEDEEYREDDERREKERDDEEEEEEDDDDEPSPRPRRGSG
ncbi:hypothetical protein CBR_g27731 [Chara braunii]|uniref:Uncharacterized protein n=1 Tax=Chara braunii TaxID=69332 RepID=A0A388L894_CHABU|nr:hypothetical protein CBR_g27731 [Chara braunii]|eukprot:GBG78504.1 hypothetical protein CBR_g27731 [Chara braunii]